MSEAAPSPAAAPPVPPRSTPAAQSLNTQGQRDVTEGNFNYGVVRTGKIFKLLQYHPSSKVFKELDLLRMFIIWLNIITMPIAFTAVYDMRSCDKTPGGGHIAAVAFSVLFSVAALIVTIYATIHDPRRRIYFGSFALQVLSISLGIVALVAL